MDIAFVIRFSKADKAKTLVGICSVTKILPVLDSLFSVNVFLVNAIKI